MGQKLSRKNVNRRITVPDMLRIIHPPPAITFRHLGIKDAEGRFADKSIPIPATKDETKKQRRHWKYWTWIKGMVMEAKAHPFFRSKKNTSDDLDDNHDEYEMDITEENWNRNIHTHMAVYALVINASNIFRFPHHCYQYGGVVFFLAFAFVSLFVIQPIIYLEMVVGQFSQRGVEGFGALHAFAKGIPQAIVFMSLVFVPYNFIVEGYTGNYAFGSFYSHAGNCKESWNKLNSCVSYDEVNRFRAPPSLKVKPIWLETSTQRTSLLSTELYFRQFILHHRWDGTEDEDLGGWNPYLFIGLGVTYILVFISIRVRLTSLSSKIIIILSGLIPFLLLILLISQILRDGAVAGILQVFYFDIRDWGNLLSLEFWSEVFRSSFLTSGIGYGLYSRIASRNPFNTDSLYRSSWTVIIIMLLILLVSTLILIAELGALRFIFDGSSYDSIFAGGTGSVFAAATGALLMFNNRACIFIFFSVCTVCGIWSQIVATENCTAQIVNWFSIATKNLQNARYVALFIVIGLQASCATLVSKAGGVILDSFLFDGTWAAALVSLAEVFSIAYMYGTVFFMIDIELMLRHSAPRLFQFQLRYSCPVALLAMFGVISFGNIYYGQQKYLGVIPIPALVVITGYIFNAVPPILIVLLAGLGLFQKKQKGLYWLPDIDYLKDVFGRIRHRRNAIFKPRDTHVHTIATDAIQRLKQIERTLSLKKLRTELTAVRNCQNARANWLRLTNKILVSEGRLNTISRVANWMLREIEVKRTRKEVKYIRNVLRNYSMECIFTVPKEVHPAGFNKERERERLAHILLNSIPPEELGFKYPERTLYERLIGKTNPIPEEDKAALVVRIKGRLEVECSRDAMIWLRLLERLEEKRKKNTVFREDTPIEFYFEHVPSRQRIRVIMFKGLDHSILINTPLPRPPLVQVLERHIRQREGPALWTYLKDVVTKEMESEKGFASIGQLKMKLIQKRKSIKRLKVLGSDKGKDSSRRASSQFIGDRMSRRSFHGDEEPATTTTTAPRSPERGQLFTPLDNWYYACDPRRYKIGDANTYFVVIIDRQALKEMVKDRFALILPPENLSGPQEIVAFNKPGVYEVTYAGIRPFLQKIAKREQMAKQIEESSVVDLPRHDSEDEVDKKSPTGQHVTQVGTRRYSDVDIPLLQRPNPVTGSVFLYSRRLSDSLIEEVRKKEVKDQMLTNIDPPIAYKSSGVIPWKEKRTEVLASSSDHWMESQLLQTRWPNSDVNLIRTTSESAILTVYSEEAMAKWLTETQEKMNLRLNEKDGFFYRHKGKKLVVEPRKGRLRTSTSDTAIWKN